MHTTTNTSEIFLIAMLMIFAIPFLVWRLGKTEYFAPLVVVQIIMGILLGPGILGAVYPNYYNFVFNEHVVLSLNGIAWWAVMIFVFTAGIELDLKQAWVHRRDFGITAGLALGTPLLLGSIAGVGMLFYPGWMGAKGENWQFVLGIGMSCAVTALPILVLFMDKLEILRQPIGQRILRYASMDDIVIWGMLAVILMDWELIGKQLGCLAGLLIAAYAFRKLMHKLEERDRWYVALVWLAACSLAAEWAGLHFMVGAFLAGAVIDANWFDQKQMDIFRHYVLLAIMPVFFLSSGLRTNWTMSGEVIIVAASVLLVAGIAGKLWGVYIAGKVLKWKSGESWLIGWLLQTKALIMIIFANVLLDKEIIASETFTALLLMAVFSTMLTIPMVTPLLLRYNSENRKAASESASMVVNKNFGDYELSADNAHRPDQKGRHAQALDRSGQLHQRHHETIE